VVTFLEDALRIVTQWSDQLLYLHDYRHSTHSHFPRAHVETQLIFFCSVPSGLTHLFLIVNVIAMVSSSVLVIARKYSDYAVAGLIGVVVTQALGYGLIFDLNFFLRNLSVMGGLLMVLSDSWVRKSKAFAGLPSIDEKDRKMYFQLAGRVLLIFLFIGFVFSGTWTIWRIIVALLGFVACVMVVVGFKAKFSAIMLVVILSVFNLLVNNFWTVSKYYSSLQLARLTNCLASRAPPTQGLRKVRLLPDSFHCRRSPPPRKQRTREVQHGREEEGLLRHHLPRNEVIRRSGVFRKEKREDSGIQRSSIFILYRRLHYFMASPR
jgi:uncharacterized membrane protein YphA (DoxX/SURF4 family)